MMMMSSSMRCRTTKKYPEYRIFIFNLVLTTMNNLSRPIVFGKGAVLRIRSLRFVLSTSLEDECA
jgi:hypothetical protein